MIHYHGGFGRANNVAITFLKGRHAMVSFAKPQDICIAAEVCQSFALDNGAYSMWKIGKKPDWEAYSKWVNKWAQHPGFDFAIIPDVIEGSEEENDELITWWYSTPRRYQSAVVWHLHESLDRLNRLAWLYPHRVCLGSSGQYATVKTPEWWERIGEAMAVITDDEGRPRCKLHGLRMLDPTVFSHIPLSSADSTNVARNCGIDVKWEGNPYCPMTEATKALILGERIEAHASASYWAGYSVQENFALIG